MTIGEVSNNRVVPRDAATVILLRDRPSGLEVFLQRRATGMAFAAGMTVFPGGATDPRDASRAVEWLGPSVAWWAQQFHCDEDSARSLVLAAIRETFEECGVLLAGPTPRATVTSTARYADDRIALEEKSLTFGEFLSREGLAVRTDLLMPWANWITPVGEKRRYDTRFFVASVPSGQTADGRTTEASDTMWMSPALALEAWKDGHSMLLPPTWAQLRELSTYASVSDVLRAERDLNTVMPRILDSPGAIPLDFPDVEAYVESGPTPWNM